MGEKRVLIIGAGVAGLAAGCYARMNGYQATIFELHTCPVGLCMAWERKGYTFDGCIHYLFGSGEGQPFHAHVAANWVPCRGARSFITTSTSA